MNMTTIRRTMICVAASCFMLTAITIAAESAEMRVARVTGNSVNMKSEPSTSGNKIASLANGDFMLVMEERKGDKHLWYKVLANGPVEGWVSGKYIEFLTEEDKERSYEPDVYERFESFSYGTVREQLPDSHEGAKQRFGKPVSEDHMPVPSHHDPDCMVNYHTLKYPDFELLYFESGGDTGLIGIEIMKPGLTLGEGVEVGADVSDVVREMGVPFFCEGPILLWSDFSSYMDFSIALDGRRVVSIKMLSWLD